MENLETSLIFDIAREYSHLLPAKGILCKRQVCASDTKNKTQLYLLQVKFDLRLKIFSPRLILNFFCLLALIIHELGQGDKGNIWEST